MIRLKSPQEIAGIKKSCQKLAELFEQLVPKVKEGMTTKDIDDICLSFIKNCGGKPAWYSEDFPGAACVSINDEVIHGIPSKKRRIKNGDIVSIDIGIALDGYISDASKSLIIGTAPPIVYKLIKTAEDCLVAGIAACKAGNRINDITNAVFSLASTAGFGVVSDFCGHGVGLSVHEEPNVPNAPGKGANPRIQAGMVLAIEPMINEGTGDVCILEDGWTVVTADGKRSAHAEHTVAVFADRTEILTL